MPPAELEIPRPRNAWIIYRQSKTALFPPLPGEQPTQLISRVSKEVSKLWKAEPKATKSAFRLLAEQENAAHAIKYPGYVFQPRKKQAGNTKKNQISKREKMKAAAGQRGSSTSGMGNGSSRSMHGSVGVYQTIQPPVALGQRESLVAHPYGGNRPLRREGSFPFSTSAVQERYEALPGPLSFGPYSINTFTESLRNSFEPSVGNPAPRQLMLPPHLQQMQVESPILTQYILGIPLQVQSSSKQSMSNPAPRQLVLPPHLQLEQVEPPTWEQCLGLPSEVQREGRLILGDAEEATLAMEQPLDSQTYDALLDTEEDFDSFNLDGVEAWAPVYMNGLLEPIAFNSEDIQDARSYY